MKELSIEQKAKRYDEAVNEIRNLRDMLLKEGVINKEGIICDNFNRIFPELKESEDEKIRKDIVTYLKSILSNKKYGDKFIETWISWLEKQGDNTAWSEEELDSITAAINNLEYLKDYCVYHQMGLEPAITFLKSLKDRVRPKQEILEKLKEWLDEYVSDLADVDTASLICSFTNYLDGIKERKETKD
jgi:hypothetical protein